jgi:hypothetical protein
MEKMMMNTVVNSHGLHQSGDDEFHQNGEQQRLARIEAQIDHTIGARPTPIAPPQYGVAQRDAINSVVDHLVHDVIENIATLKKRLSALEQQVLSSGAEAKATLTAQITVCSRVREQCHQIGEVIDEISQKVTDLS